MRLPDHASQQRPVPSTLAPSIPCLTRGLYAAAALHELSVLVLLYALLPLLSLLLSAAHLALLVGSVIADLAAQGCADVLAVHSVHAGNALAHNLAARWNSTTASFQYDIQPAEHMSEMPRTSPMQWPATSHHYPT